MTGANHNRQKAAAITINIPKHSATSFSSGSIEVFLLIRFIAF